MGSTAIGSGAAADLAFSANASTSCASTKGISPPDASVTAAASIGEVRASCTVFFGWKLARWVRRPIKALQKLAIATSASAIAAQNSQLFDAYAVAGAVAVAVAVSTSVFNTTLADVDGSSPSAESGSEYELSLPAMDGWERTSSFADVVSLNVGSFDLAAPNAISIGRIDSAGWAESMAAVAASIDFPIGMDPDDGLCDGACIAQALIAIANTINTAHAGRMLFDEDGIGEPLDGRLDISLRDHERNRQ
ncbi:hypothetical protein [Pseudoxanthomonas sp. UTMC 1351]|uniref:hypothetical protein n=1 Tax=Pseudoxanthomonas sp. UTMC 1351 TaxID=2695853 RepID=UPI0034CF64CD